MEDNIGNIALIVLESVLESALPFLYVLFWFTLGLPVVRKLVNAYMDKQSDQERNVV